ncbi:MAG: C40 family peptidase [Zavarzinia sp.]|nr:C40 family peptidase [Zavarzinia sp.]
MTTPFDRRLTPARDDLAAAFLKGKVDAARFVAGEAFHVIVAHAGLRPRPEAACPIDTEILYGEGFTVYEDRKDGWLWGQLDTDGYVGYIPRAAVTRGEAPVASHVVAVPRSHLYPAPDLKRPTVIALSMGARLRAVGESADGRWLALSCGRFIYKAHAALVDVRVSDLVVTAESFLGTPYLWGGRTAAGIDCSGLVQTAYARAGHYLPRDSDLQAAWGTGVAEGDIRRGDILCYAGHVALARGDGTIVHATATPMAVTVEPRAALEERIRAEKGLGPDQPVLRAVRRA